MFGVLIVGGAVRVGIVHRAAMAAGDHYPATRFGLDMIEKIDQHRIDKLLVSPDGKGMLLVSAAVEIVGSSCGVFVVDVGRVEARTSAPEILFGDPGMATDIGHLPGIPLPETMLRRHKSILHVVVLPVDELSPGIQPPQLLLFRLLHPGTPPKESE